MPAPEPVVHFNHSQLRASRLWLQPRQATDIMTTTEPALLIALATGAGLKIGEAKWLEPSSRTRLTNTVPAPIDLLRFDFKTRPVETRR